TCESVPPPRESHSLKVTLEELPTIAGGPLLHDPRLELRGHLLKVEQVLELMAVGRQPHFELLDRALYPVCELKAPDVPLSLAAQYGVACGQIADELQHVESRALSGSVGAAKECEHIELSLERDEAAEVVGVQPGDHSNRCFLERGGSVWSRP